MKLPTLRTCEKVAGPARKWAGNCDAVAHALVNAGVVKGVVTRGLWYGPISPKSVFSARPFTAHSWITLADGRVFDPTRWAFGDGPPALYIGPCGPEYDAGGNTLRGRVLPSAAWRHVERVLRLDYVDGQEPGVITFDQLHWLANAPLSVLEPFAAVIYTAISTLGHKALIPIDNYHTVLEGS